MAKWKRYVLTSNAEGRSYVKSSEADMVKEEAGAYYRVELWTTREMPVDNSIEDDRARSSVSREPPPGGSTFRMLEIFPDLDDPQEQRRKIEKLHRETQQKHVPTEQDYARHPSMHRTDTCDVIFCVSGEIYLMTDTDEVLMRPGDSTVIRGVNHGWSNRSNAPCLLAVTMHDASLPPA
ncbi:MULTISPECIES: cupin domain-containing protein [unclassified Beijerinckia]|uniref:cupin domain-containing protein n=1 Tax=unclassified Beijerinckia TaxID=2638183 RepID=UPI00089D5AF8|nr:MULTISPECIES: cupin domain-containing protein [unclassified Beijerinckia]MDH7794236.1 mannose-6-phosphate isomerase-like protein (cupin superfamily) [Beijerinckia sp. GAS462]SEB56496.1 Cupin domain protein [Beijerinckia sp. 28-YEA-48]